MDDLKYIQEQVSEGDRFNQLAEEATELIQAVAGLAHAVLKLRRATEGTNPTPVSVEEAREMVVEELADVFTCLSALGIPDKCEQMRIDNIVDEKTWRWVRRLRSDV